MAFLLYSYDSYVICACVDAPCVLSDHAALVCMLSVHALNRPLSFVTSCSLGLYVIYACVDAPCVLSDHAALVCMLAVHALMPPVFCHIMQPWFVCYLYMR